MFKINLAITKSTKSLDSNVLVIEWIASDPTIDRDEERFSEQAVVKMSEEVNTKSIPIKVEHENKFYSEIWIWKEAKLVNWDTLYVRWEIDLNLSLARDIEVLLNKWVSIALSVWGRVIEAWLEYSKELWKSIKVYKDIILDEISVVKNPSNKSATLALAKSFDFEKNTETTEAITIAESTKELVKTEVVADVKWAVEKMATEDKKKRMVKTLKVLTEQIDWVITKYEDAECCETSSEMKEWLSQVQLETLVTIIRILQEIDLENIPRPAWLEWENVDKLPNFSFVPGIGWNMFPHRNPDFSLNKQWIIYWLAQLVNGSYIWLTPKEYNWALVYLYNSYKLASMKPTKSAMKEETTEEPTWVLTEDDVILMKACYEFKVLKSWNRPQFSGNDLSDVEISKMASAFSIITKRKSANTTISATLAEGYKKSFTKSEDIILNSNTESMNKIVKTEDGQEVVVSEATTPVAWEETVTVTPTEEATVTPVTVEWEEATADWEIDKGCAGKEKKKMNKSEEEETQEGVNIDGAEDVVATEEAVTDSSLNKTSIEESEVKDDSVVAEEATKSLDENKAGLDEVRMTQIAEKAVETLSTNITKQLGDLSKALQDLAKSFASNSEAVTKSSTAKEDKLTMLEQAIVKQANISAMQSKIIEDFGKQSLGRKSVATYAALEKSFSKNDDSLNLEERVTKFMDEGKSFSDARTLAVKEMAGQ